MKPAKESKARFYARKLAGWSKLNVMLRHDFIKRDVLLASPAERHRILFGASRSQLERLVAFGRRWVEGLEQRHATFAAERMRQEIFADAAGELDEAYRRSLPPRPRESEASFTRRKLAYLRALRGRLER